MKRPEDVKIGDKLFTPRGEKTVERVTFFKPGEVVQCDWQVYFVGEPDDPYNLRMLLEDQQKLANGQSRCDCPECQAWMAAQS